MFDLRKPLGFYLGPCGLDAMDELHIFLKDLVTPF
jgi:hypothetical protein